MSEAAIRTQCAVCQKDIEPTTLYCNECLAQYKPCKVCAYRIPLHADRCNLCQSYQGVFRQLIRIDQTTVAVATAVAALLMFLYTQCTNFRNRHSNTTIAFVAADANYVYVDTSNSGRASSVVRRCWLRFRDLEIEDVELTLRIDKTRNVRRVVPAKGESQLKLQVKGLVRSGKTDRNAILKKLHDKNVTVEIEVEESDGRNRKVVDAVDASAIHDLINNKLSGGAP